MNGAKLQQAGSNFVFSPIAYIVLIFAFRLLFKINNKTTDPFFVPQIAACQCDYILFFL